MAIDKTSQHSSFTAVSNALRLYVAVHLSKQAGVCDLNPVTQSRRETGAPS